MVEPGPRHEHHQLLFGGRRQPQRPVGQRVRDGRMSVIEPKAQRIRYRFYDFVSYNYYGDLPLTGVTFGARLNTAGSFKGTLPLGDQRVYQLGPFTATQP